MRTLKNKWTYQEYLLFPDDGKRHELLDGEHVMTPAPGTRHQRISLTLSTAIKLFLDEHHLGELLVAPCDVVLSEVDVVQPDLLFISTTRQGIVTENNIQGAPDLMIEILSQGTRKTDEIIKRKLYELHDIKEYWILDPDLESVKIYRKNKDAFQPPIHLSREQHGSLATPLLPGFQVDLADLFA